MTKKTLPTRRQTRIDGKMKRYSHYVWFLNTGHWPAKGMDIHHIDGDIKNDEFSNLALMSHSEHTRLSNIERSVSKETRAKMSMAQMGEKNPRWKGDDVTPRVKYRRIWRVKRRADKEGNT